MSIEQLVHQIVSPTPYAIGPVNAYLIEAEPLTLIDSGVNYDPGQDALVAGIEAAGHVVEDIERILITHAHPDHYGLVHVVQEASGATIYFPELELKRVRDRQMLFEVGRLLLEAGMPLDLLFRMDQERRNAPRPAMRGHHDVIPVKHGDTFSFRAPTGSPAPARFELEAIHSPGHTGGHIVYREPQTATLFAGDQLLPNVSPNPLLESNLAEPGERRRSLAEYLRSLHKMRTMGLRLAYPGHGDPVHDPNALIDRTTEHHLKRKAEVAARLGPQGVTPYELALDFYPDSKGYDSFLAVSEIVAHLDLVVTDGDAEVEVHEGVTYYRAAPG
jgi:glyoxylase-like metal-dependent hydrolase (beta-lactamase superfamily II)